MISRRTIDFKKQYDALPEEIKKIAIEKYQLWKENPQHPSLRFKLLDRATQTYSVRINLAYRAVCIKKEETYIWYFIGHHDEYDRL